MGNEKIGKEDAPVSDKLLTFQAVAILGYEGQKGVFESFSTSKQRSLDEFATTFEGLEMTKKGVPMLVRVGGCAYRSIGGKAMLKTVDKDVSLLFEWPWLLVN